MIWELFLVGSFWFWALCVIEVAWLLRSLHEESGWGIGMSLVGLGVVLWLFGDFNVFAWAWMNPLFMLECVGAYLVLGVVWSLSKWKMLCNDIRTIVQEARVDFRKEHKIAQETIPVDLRGKWGEYLGNRDWSELPRRGRYHGAISSIEDVIPHPRDYKATILYWLGYWPLSMIWFFFHDMIERVFNWIYQTFSKLYRSIARNTFAGIPDDFGGKDENRT